MVELELWRNAFSEIRAIGIRSNLTILGIVIGIAAIVALVSLGDGLNSSISGQFEMLGTDTLMVLPGKGFATSIFAKLYEEDIDRIEAVRGVDFASGIYILTAQVEFKNEKKTTMVLAVDAKKIEKLSVSKIIEIGTGSGIRANTFDLMVGEKYSEQAFEKQVKLNQTLYVSETPFKVVGILKKSTNMFGAMFDTAIITDKEALKKALNQTIYPTRIFVNLLPGANALDVKARIERDLKKAHGEEDFQVVQPSQLAETASSVVGIVQLVLLGIAAISLIVGGIGIMNTMFMNVTERTKDIGVMKAVGATNQKVLQVFLSEAALMGMIGGIIGAILGTLISIGISFAAGFVGFDLPLLVNPFLIIGAIAFAVAVGVASGAVPAINAARLDPVEALRKR